MSVSLEVFLRAENLPTRETWQQAIDAEGIGLQLDECDPSTQEGFWPCKLNGIDCGFEYFFGQTEPAVEPKKTPRQGWWFRLFGTATSSSVEEPEEVDEVQAAVGDRKHVVEFVWHSSIDDGRAASFAAAVLAKITDGFFLDPQGGELTPGKDAVELVKSQDRSERDLKMERAISKWAHATQRLCPTCGAPCPEYRPTCLCAALRLVEKNNYHID